MEGSKKSSFFAPGGWRAEGRGKKKKEKKKIDGRMSNY